MLPLLCEMGLLSSRGGIGYPIRTGKLTDRFVKTERGAR
jgi:hypothetical protein